MYVFWGMVGLEALKGVTEVKELMKLVGEWEFERIERARMTVGVWRCSMS